MRTAGGPGIRLDDLLARGITLQWAEAVALVQATCRQLVVTAASGFPSTAQIMLYEEGAAVALATVDQPQVRAAAHLLASALPDVVPVQLRLLVWQATGAGNPYANLDEFAVALASFERADRPALLGELYRRAAAAPARAASTLAPPAPPFVLTRILSFWRWNRQAIPKPDRPAVRATRQPSSPGARTDGFDHAMTKS